MNCHVKRRIDRTDGLHRVPGSHRCGTLLAAQVSRYTAELLRRLRCLSTLLIDCREQKQKSLNYTGLDGATGQTGRATSAMSPRHAFTL